MNSLRHQKGMTAIGWLLVLGLIAFFTLVTLRLLPFYLEAAKVTSVLESLKNEPQITGKSKGDILGIIAKRFDVNDVKEVKAKDAKIVKADGNLSVQFKWEQRAHLLANVDVVAVFDKKVEVPAN